MSAKKTIYFDGYCGYTVAVIAENGKVTEFNFEKQKKSCAVGNIYKGRVESVLNGMQAAFINCGLERNCFLSADDFLPDSEKYEGTVASEYSFPDLKEGDEILVQIAKLPVGKKGAKVTTHLSFVGNYLIYLPDSPFIGVSRKIDDEELRHNLAYTAKHIKNENEGLVVRTAAPYARHGSIKQEYRYLKKLHEDLIAKAATAQVGELLHTDDFLTVRVLRDVLSRDVDKIVVGNAQLKETVERLIGLYPEETRRPVVFNDTGRDLLDETGISKQILAIASPRVDLENGGYIIIEKTEALTVIDVNTGKFTGDYNLEQTVYHTNLLAAREIARQVRLRNVGGIVVVDFIDMNSVSHNRALVEEFERLLKTDKAKCIVSPMSQFGLVEFTRKRLGANPLNFMIKPCKYCREAGYTMTEEYVLFGLRAKLLNAFADGAKAVRIDMNADVLNKLTNWQEFLTDLKERAPGVKIYAVPHRTYHEEQLNIRLNEFDIPSDAVKIM
ncbi:MAG: Rne/Rng family ribonuclease [Clostridia bacterium]|nr:Rne/Rng family ribonuclease [Clostridia bacterium]